MKPNKYELPKEEEIFIDESGQETIAVEDLTPFEQIKLIAEKFKINIGDPKKNCNHCRGRGYVGFRILNPVAKHKQTKSYTKETEPVPCSCLFTKEDLQKSSLSMYLNRETKRSIERQSRKMIAKKRMAKAKIEKMIEQKLKMKAKKTGKSIEELNKLRIEKSKRKASKNGKNEKKGNN